MTSDNFKDSSKCSRCEIMPIEYKCDDCPISYNSFCSSCDTQVHSIIPQKRMHNRVKFGKYLETVGHSQEYLKALDIVQRAKKEKDIKEIEHLNKKIEIMKKNKDNLVDNDKKLFEENTQLKQENEKLIRKNDLILNKQINLEKTIQNLTKCLNNKEQVISELNTKNEELMNEIQNLNKMKNENNNSKKEIEDLYNFKINEVNKEKDYLVKEIAKMTTFTENKYNEFEKIKKENDELRKKILFLEQKVNYFIHIVIE